MKNNVENDLKVRGKYQNNVFGDCFFTRQREKRGSNTNEKQCFDEVFERAKKFNPDETFFVDRLYGLFCPLRSSNYGWKIGQIRVNSPFSRSPQAVSRSHKSPQKRCTTMGFLSFRSQRLWTPNSFLEKCEQASFHLNK